MLCHPFHGETVERIEGHPVQREIEGAAPGGLRDEDASSRFAVGAGLH